MAPPPDSNTLIVLDGSKGEGGGQILRTALSLSLLTGRPFRIEKIRANREKPGLRPQHLTAVRAAAELGNATVEGAALGARELMFSPSKYVPSDISLDIGTAGATGMVLQTLHLPMALRADRPARVTMTGGTFNTQAPSYPFLETTWRTYMTAIGLPVALAMPEAGFYPSGGGRLEAWIEPGEPQPLRLDERGPLLRIRGAAGVANLQHGDIAERMAARAERRLADLGVEVQIDRVVWSSPGQGAAIYLTAEHQHPAVASTFVGLGARGKRAELVADEAVDELLAYEIAPGAVDPHSADQLLLPLCLAEGSSSYTVGTVTEHLRTNIHTIRSFLNRTITVDSPNPRHPGRVTIS